MNITVGAILSNGTGGEGSVHEVVGRSDLVYKRYKPFKITSALENKLIYMVSNRPVNISNTTLGVTISWPIQLMKTTSGKLDGFVMPRLIFNKKLNDIYEDINFPYDGSVIIGKNLCRLVDDLHRADTIIGDFNHGNVCVYDRKCVVSMVDCDSFHLGLGKYPCCVCMDGYAAPELLKYMKSKNTMRYEEAPFSKNTDLFSLAVHIFRLLMKGISPYNGINTQVTTSSAVVTAGNDPIEKGLYVFRQGLVPAHPACPPKYILPDQLMSFFDRAFDTVYTANSAYPNRPDAHEWDKVLHDYQSSLVQCPKKDTHLYYSQLTTCPWCEAEQREAIYNTTKSISGLPSYKVRRR